MPGVEGWGRATMLPSSGGVSTIRGRTLLLEVGPVEELVTGGEAFAFCA